MPHIDCYFGTFSPFTYLAGLRFEEIAAAYGATVTYKPLDLMALFARTGGVPPKERHPNRQAYRLQEMTRIAARAGLPLNLQPTHFPTNPAPSSYAFIAAQKAGGGDLGQLRFAIGRSCWADDLDIADDGVIRACLEEAGFDSALADSGLLAGAEEYAANLEEAIDRGAFGAPFYIADGDARFWGQDRLDDLEWYLKGG